MLILWPAPFCIVHWTTDCEFTTCTFTSLCELMSYQLCVSHSAPPPVCLIDMQLLSHYSVGTASMFIMVTWSHIAVYVLMCPNFDFRGMYSCLKNIDLSNGSTTRTVQDLYYDCLYDCVDAVSVDLESRWPQLVAIKMYYDMSLFPIWRKAPATEV